MSNPRTQPPSVPVSGTVLIICAAATFCVVIGVSGLVFVAVDESKNPVGLVAMFLAAFSAFMTSIATLVTVGKIKAQVDYLANGGSDAKARAALADVLNPSLIRDDAQEQLVADRIHRGDQHKS